MLCSRINKILRVQTLFIRQSHLRSFGASNTKCAWKNSMFSALNLTSMSSYKLRLFLRDFTVTRLWNACFRTQFLNSMVKRCHHHRSHQRRWRLGVWSCVKQTLFRPSRTLLLSVAAYNGDDEDGDGDEDEEREGTGPCDQDISAEDLEALVNDFEGVDDLSRTTLFCEVCRRRLVIDKKNPNVNYCNCAAPQPHGLSPDGWVPYMEGDDEIIWRKEYKPGGLYAYKVYGRYKELTAHDFAMIQVDGAYRRLWDSAVASLTVVQPEANGVPSQAVLHWEVLWPRLFANRDYVFIRRHKEFDVQSKHLTHKEAIFTGIEEHKPPQPPEPPRAPPQYSERPSVHSRAKRKAQEMEEREEREREREGPQPSRMEEKTNKVYVIISRSCTHPDIPETKHVIRVQEYWSHMVVRTVDGPDTIGMEFVLTYYDEPTTGGGMPGGVSSWATGRAAGSYLKTQRAAAHKYKRWRQQHKDVALDLATFESSREPASPTPRPTPMRFLPRATRREIDEREMESAKRGPEIDDGYEPRHKSTQTDGQTAPNRDVTVTTMSKADNEANVDDKNKVDDKSKTTEKGTAEGEAKVSDKVTEKAKANDKVAPYDEVTVTETVKVEVTEADKVGEGTTDNVDSEACEQAKVQDTSKDSESKDEESENKLEEQTEGSEGDEAQKASWWRYLYPFYYFV